jgi:arylsulfatase A-like enzyme
MSSTSVNRLPDILIVLMDTARVSDFCGGENETGTFPFCHKLQQQCIVFPRASTVGPWSMPSHTSLLSGRYPWETGVHARGAMRVPSSIKLLPSYLTPLGYRTISLSANGFNSPQFGLTNGFQEAAWGEWWERYLRIPNRQFPSSYFPRSTRAGRRFRDSIEHLADFGVQTFHRFPMVLNTGLHLSQKIMDPERPYDPRWCSWIEPTLQRWVRSVPPSVPICAFIVYMDAHEPYLVDVDGFQAFGDWRRSLQIRSDRSNAILGRWKPTTEQLSVLRLQYDRMLELLDRRIETVVGAFEGAGRWSNTLMCLTSDHGQAFGDGGHLFHFISDSEALLRVPLWIRLPGAENRGRNGRGWASLVDILPTILQRTDPRGADSLSGIPLDRLIDAERPRPAYAIADGVLPNEAVRTNASTEQLASIDRVRIIAYRENWKVIFSSDTRKLAAYDVERDPAERVDRWAIEATRFPGLAQGLEDISSQMEGRPITPIDKEVSERLVSWGYG